jgi:hypothetical protein
MTVVDGPAGTPVVSEPPERKPADDPLEGPEPDRTTNPTQRWRTLLVAAGGYLLLSVIIWWNVWSGHPTSTATCECGDSSLFTWFLEWPAYAISHGLNPLYSTAMFHPEGANLLANTGELAFGVVLAPITWMFGPVATLNVALTLSPALSALAMFVLLRRWVSWSPAAFAGGLFYGFSPFILTNLTNAHLNFGAAMVLPLIVACLDELLIRQRRRPVVTGVVLGLLVTLQFFLGTEALLMMAIMGFTGAVLVVAYAAWQHPEALRGHARYATVGLTSGLITGVVLLAYPVWFALAGPAHFSGPIWRAFNLRSGGTELGYLVIPESTSAVRSGLGLFALVYPGPHLSAQYFGIGVLAVLIGGFISWRRDRRLWLFGAIALVSIALSLGAQKDSLLPWQLLSGLPLLDDVEPYRFILVTYLAVGVLLGLIVDHTYQAVDRLREAPTGGHPGAPTAGIGSRLPPWAGAAAGVIVAAIALVPPAAYLAQNVPIRTEPVAIPTWFRTVAPHLSGDQVLLAFPAPFTTWESAMTWQAVDRMHYAMVGGGGPGVVLAQTSKEREGQSVIGAASFSFTAPMLKAGDVQAVRRALDGWGVTMVVLPDQPDLPAYDQIPSVTFAAALVTAATGQRPIHQADAWVWSGVGKAPPPVLLTPAAFSGCTKGVTARGASAVDAATDCVLAAGLGRSS